MATTFGTSLYGELGARHRTLNIPHFQRPYKWQPDRVVTMAKLIWAESQQRPSSETFIGTIITAARATERDIDVIDGQQRLTSFAILAAAARRAFNNSVPGLVTRAHLRSIDQAFSSALWYDECDGGSKSFRMVNVRPERQRQWEKLFDGDGEPVDPGVLGGFEDQYAINYV